MWPIGHEEKPKEIHSYSCLFVFIRGSSLSTPPCFSLEWSARRGGGGAACLNQQKKELFAREKALANRRLARQAGDPLSEKRRVQGIPTFAEAATRVLEQKQGGIRAKPLPLQNAAGADIREHRMRDCAELRQSRRLLSHRCTERSLNCHRKQQHYHTVLTHASVH